MGWPRNLVQCRRTIFPGPSVSRSEASKPRPRAGSIRRNQSSSTAGCETKEGMLDRIEREIVVSGPPDDQQRARLLEMADRCPVHRTLTSEISIRTRLGPSSPAGALTSLEGDGPEAGEDV